MRTGFTADAVRLLPLAGAAPAVAAAVVAAAVVAAGVVTTAVVTTGTAVGQNSTRKIRPQPSKVAARAGSAVKWRQDLESALAESRKQKKPVFWYVPTLRGSPMDRKREIDRYMMAGPFCWPRLITLLNQHYIPVKAYPRGGLARDLDLRRGRFIEPGYVVLDGDGKELRRLDRITTFHPEWFLRPLAKLVGKPVPKRELPAPLASAWRAVRSCNYQKAGEVLNLHALGDLDKAWHAEAYYVIGVAELRQGRSDEALKRVRGLPGAAGEGARGHGTGEPRACRCVRRG
ncbi:MAG: hypothetical protein ACYST0_14695 [Planctomycetota bacterium]|jgi:hypothetical protein